MAVENKGKLIVEHINQSDATVAGGIDAATALVAEGRMREATELLERSAKKAVGHTLEAERLLSNES